MVAETKPSEQTWGTGEELLLACAVERHGTHNWDFIAMEVQRRTSNLSFLTGKRCMYKFDELKRRFSDQNGNPLSLEDMVVEHRRLHMEKLRREVDEGETRIKSLELTLKQLEDEADLPEKKKPPAVAAGDDDRSFDESNSTKREKTSTMEKRNENDTAEAEGKEANKKPEPKNTTELGLARSDPNGDGDCNRNGEYLNIDDDKEKEANGKNKMKTKGGPSEFGDGGSNREVKEKEKPNSDVQSSASLSLIRNKQRRRGGGGEPVCSGGDGGHGLGVWSSSGEETDGGADEISPAMKLQYVVKSQPLARFLEYIRSNRLSSVFERRLRISQETQTYKNLIRRHIDLQTVQSRLDRGMYANCFPTFFRDLLLLFNNAFIFFNKNSPESRAALKFKSLVLKEMKDRLYVPPNPFARPSITACGTARTSLKALKPASASKRTYKRDRDIDDHYEVEQQKSRRRRRRTTTTTRRSSERNVERSVIVKEADKDTRKKITTDSSVSAYNTRSTRMGNQREETKHRYGGNELSSHDSVDLKLTTGRGAGGRRGKGTASSLRRTKQISSSETTDHDDDHDSSEDDGSEDEEEEDEKKSRSTYEARKNARRRGGREESCKGRRGDGSRPLRRQAATRTSEYSSTSRVKRGRDGGDSQVVTRSVGRARKMTRR